MRLKQLSFGTPLTVYHREESHSLLHWHLSSGWHSRGRSPEEEEWKRHMVAHSLSGSSTTIMGVSLLPSMWEACLGTQKCFTVILGREVQLKLQVLHLLVGQWIINIHRLMILWPHVYLWATGAYRNIGYTWWNKQCPYFKKGPLYLGQGETHSHQWKQNAMHSTL